MVQARRPCDRNIRDVPRKLETSVAGRGSGKEVVRDEVRAKGGLRATERMLAFALREIAAIAGFWAEGHDVVHFKWGHHPASYVEGLQGERDQLGGYCHNPGQG